MPTHDTETPEPHPTLTVLGDPRPKGCLQVAVSGVGADALSHAWATAPDSGGPWTLVPGARQAEFPVLVAHKSQYVRAEVAVDARMRLYSEPVRIAETAGNPGIDWLHSGRYGVCSHFLAEFINRVAENDREQWHEGEGWDDLLDTFDVERYVSDVTSTGAAFVILTLGQNSGYLLAPNPTYDTISGIEPGQRTPSRRDLVREVGEALELAGVRLILYLPANPPNNAHLAEGDFTITKRFGQSCGVDGIPSQKTMGLWQRVIREYSERYGRLVAGWWFDGVFPDMLPAYDDMTADFNWVSLTAAAKAGNMSRVVTYNRGVGLFPTDNPWLDYTSGEINELGSTPVGRWADADGTIQWFALTYLGEDDPIYFGWGNRGTSKKTDDLRRWASGVIELGGVVCFDGKVNRFGCWDADQLAQLRALRTTIDKLIQRD